MTRKSQLAAWTENGRVRMLPSLVHQMALPYVESIAELESERPRDFRVQPRYLMELSRAYEALAIHYERFGHIPEAFEAYVAAATKVTDTDDFWWNDCDEGFILSMPFRGRFFTMYGRCSRLFRKYPALKDTGSYNSLMQDYRRLTAVTDIWDAKFKEECENARAWKFGRR